MICINCNKEHNENFCPNCGERSGVKKITFRSTMEDAFSTLTNMDKGFLFNIKALVINPKKLTTDYLIGKRRGILNPISFLIISISIYLVIESIFKVPREITEPTVNSIYFNKGVRIGKAAGVFINSYYKYFLIFTIFLLANSTKLLFGKYNYLEHLAISSFIVGLATMVSIIPFLLLNFKLIANPVFYFVVLLLVYRIFKKGLSTSDSILLSFTSMFLFVTQLFLVIAVIGLLMSTNSWG